MIGFSVRKTEMASVTAQLQLLQQLEGQLRKLTKEKTFSEPAVRDVRKQLRAAAESVVLKNYAVSEVRCAATAVA